MKCELCGEHDLTPTTITEDINLMIEHMRLFHPHIYDQMEFWPDGGVVLHHEEVEPEDFQ